MNIIYKYPLETFSNEIELPWGAEPLTVQMQDGVPVLWAKFDPERGGSQKVKRTFILVATGYEFPFEDGSYYIATIQMKNGLVWHVFEI